MEKDNELLEKDNLNVMYVTSKQKFRKARYTDGRGSDH